MTDILSLNVDIKFDPGDADVTETEHSLVTDIGAALMQRDDVIAVVTARHDPGAIR